MEIYAELAALNADAAVLSAYGRIIPQEVIDLFPAGIINLHPSLLPKYRGPTPIESAILNGDTETGVSIMQLTAEMDAGPVYTQATLPLTGKEDKFELYQKLSTIGTQLLLDSLPAILSGELKPVPQSDNATYCQLITKQDGIMDWNKSASRLEREVRAYAKWPKSRAILGTKEVIVTKAHVASERKTQLDIMCADTFLSIDELIGPSGRTMSAKDFLNGYAAG
jgi:methionyl-tRNA formyltransferase